MNKKYELLASHAMAGGSDLFQIRALRDFGDVKKGDLGGYVECEDNLSHEGDCWVGLRSMVYKGGRVVENAYICDGATVSDSSVVFGDFFAQGKIEISGGLRFGGDMSMVLEVGIDEVLSVEGVGYYYDDDRGERFAIDEDREQQVLDEYEGQTAYLTEVNRSK